jgi:hypothetical protein
MTVLDSFEKLNEYFSQKPSFTFEDNFREVIAISEDEPLERASLTCALKELEDSGVLKSTEVDNKKYWILFKPLESFDQQIEISYLLAAGISSVINNVCDIVGNSSDKSDPKQITERDLQNLLVIASKASEENLKENA